MKTDTVENEIFYVETFDLWWVPDDDGEPDEDDWVVVSRAGDDVTIGPYNGQDYISVVRWLEYYELTNSDQRCPAQPERDTYT